MSYIVKSMMLGEIQTNTYIAYDDEVGEAIIVDPAASENLIEQKIAQLGVKPVAILLTHGHFDHIGAVEGLRNRYDIKVYAYEDERDILGTDANLAIMMGKRISIDADEYLEDLQVFELGGVRYQVIHTPGHTKGSCCYYVDKEKVLFSGDTMFCRSYGRTDFPTGNYNQLMNSLQRLLQLSDDVIVYPGHNDETKIGDERKMYDFD